jgi:uncharacterized membrane protein
VSKPKPISFAVIVYADRERAGEALAVIEHLADEKHVKLRDAAIVVRGAAGGLELHQTRELSVGQGAVTGGVAGMLFGLALGGPIGAALVGMAGGGVLGVLDTGIRNERMKEVGESLDQRQAALCVLIESADWALVRERMEPLGGELLVAELTDDAAAALERARGQVGASDGAAP